MAAAEHVDAVINERQNRSERCKCEKIPVFVPVRSCVKVVTVKLKNAICHQLCVVEDPEGAPPGC